MIERRIARLSADAVRLARCAAVAAPDFSIELASHVLGLRTLDLADPCAELEAAQVLRDGAFVHDLIYESALASVPAPVARQLHAEVAAFLQQRQGEPARLAQHWVQAGESAPAGAAFLAAAERSRRTASLPSSAACSPRRRAASSAPACLPSASRRCCAAPGRSRRTTSVPRRSAAVEAVEQAATSDEQRLLALDARLELTMTRYELHESLRLGEQAIAAARALGRNDLELRFAITLSGALCDARRADEAVALLEPHAPWVRAHADVEQQWEYWKRPRSRSTTPTGSATRCPPGRRRAPSRSRPSGATWSGRRCPTPPRRRPRWAWSRRPRRSPSRRTGSPAPRTRP